MVEPSTMYIDENHEFLSTFKYFAHSDGLEIKVIKGDTKVMLAGIIMLSIVMANRNMHLLILVPYIYIK